MTRFSSLAFHLRSVIIDHRSLIVVTCSLILIGLILVAPLLQSSPLCTDDGSLHLYRTVALDRAIGDGLLYPRWFPDLAYGYGFPFFNYREPLGYYAVESFHLIGLSFPLALNMVLAFSVIASGLTVTLWVGDIFDQRAGFIAGIVYMAAPYTLIGSLTRANLPEVIAMALMPLIMWAFRRFMIFAGRRHFALAVLSYAALLLTHNISSLIFTPVLVAYCLLLIASAKRPVAPSLFRSIAAMLIALAMTSFFWLPALAEGNYAQLYLTYSTRGNDYHFNFLSFGELFGGPGSSDPALLNPPLQIIFGWAQIALAALGIFAIRRVQSREQRVHIIAALVALIGFIFMALPISQVLWDNLPLIRFVQFPWRFVGRALLPAALLAGAFVHVALHSSLFTRHRAASSWDASRPRLSVALSIVLAIVVLLFAAPLLYPRTCPIKDNPTITDVFAYERATGHIGVDPLGAYLPVSVQERPQGSPLEQQYANNETIKRFDRSALPSGAQIIAETYRPNQAGIDLDTPTAFRATYLTFDFPGWQVKIDDQPVPIIPSEPNGLIAFDAPAGQHRITVAFGSTPIRTLADILSAMGLVALIITLLRIKPATPRKVDHSSFSFHPSALILVPIVFILIKLLLIDPQLTPLRQTRLQNDQLGGISQPLQIDFGDQLRLLGYEISSSSTPSGETRRVDLYWRALRPLDTAYQTTVGVVDANGELWTPKTLERPRDYQDFPPTTAWPTDAYTIDSFELPINPGTPPGSYSIYAEVFARDSLIPLPAHAAAVHPASRPAAAIIGPIDITRAVRAFNADQLGIYNFKLDQPITSDLKLLGFNVDRSDIIPGDTVLLTTFWQATQSPQKDDTLTIELLDQHGQLVTSKGFPLGGGRYPSSRWTADEQIIDLDRVRVPASTPSGVYHWRGSISDVIAFDLGELRVTAPERSFEIPANMNRIDQMLGNRVTLLGYETKGQGAIGKELAVTLYWRAEADLSDSYKVFVHLLDQNGQVRAQVDAIPVNGTRPTTSWLPGEIVTDIYTIKLPTDLPAEQYRLVAGLYQELDNIRLKLPNGNDHIELTTIDLAP